MIISRIVAVVLLLGAVRVGAQPEKGGATALPIPVQFGTTSADDVPSGAVQSVADAILAGMPSAGMASLSAAPLLLDLRLSARSMGQSDAGMRIILRAEVAAVLSLRAGTGVVGSVRITRTGNGRDLSAAASQALSQLANDDAAIRSALTDIAQQAAGSFEASCDEVMANIQSRAASRDYDEALTVAMTVPIGAPTCRTRARAALSALYTQRSQWQCGTALQRAVTAQAAGQLRTALSELRYVDPLSPCRARIAALVSEIGAEATRRQAAAEAARATELSREWAFRSQALNAATSLERQRIVVIGQIAEVMLRPRPRDR